MKKQLIIASAALLLGTFACKKNENTPPLQQQGLDANEVAQKMYDLDSEQTGLVIKTFKNNFSTTSNLRSANNQASLAADSSIWLLEAALNSDFDQPKTIEEQFKDSIKITAPVLNNEIDATEFNSTYLTLKNLVAQKTVNNIKVQVIDITAKIVDNNIEYFLDITLFASSAAQRTTGACDPFTAEKASPSLFATTFPSYANTFLTCSGNPTLDGPSQIELKLNSCSFPACSNGYYYTNIVGRNGFDTQLYYKTGLSLSAFCLTANKEINATSLNSYKNRCNTLANNWKSTLPGGGAGLSIINNYDIQLEITSLACGCPNDYWAYWRLYVQYGTLNCNNGGGS